MNIGASKIAARSAAKDETREERIAGGWMRSSGVTLACPTVEGKTVEKKNV